MDVAQWCYKWDCMGLIAIVSSDRSSYTDDGLLYIRAHFFRFSLSPLMQLKSLKQYQCN